jgi:hypothetical protein
MSSEIFINITKEKKEMTNVQLENEIDCNFRDMPCVISRTDVLIDGHVRDVHPPWRIKHRIGLLI